MKKTHSTPTPPKRGLDYTPQKGEGRHLSYGIAPRQKCGRTQTTHLIVARRLEIFAGTDLPPLEGPPTCRRHDILLPDYAPDHCATYRGLCDHFEAQVLPNQVDLAGILTLRFPHRESRHRNWEETRAFMRARIVDARQLPVILAMHVPSIAGRASLPHIHAVLFTRALPGPDFSAFDPDLTGDGARALLLREWDAWRNRGQ
jgi:hypothetical protein